MIRERTIGVPHIITIGIIAFLVLWLVATALGKNAIVQEEIARAEFQQTQGEQILEPVFSGYQGTIGTTEAELLVRIDTTARFESEDDYFYVLSEAESAQFLVDAERKVKMISLKYYGSDSSAPTYEEVFGKDVVIKMTPDGNVYNLVNYPEAGFWIAYYGST